MNANYANIITKEERIHDFNRVQILHTKQFSELLFRFQEFYLFYFHYLSIFYSFLQYFEKGKRWKIRRKITSKVNFLSIVTLRASTFSLVLTSRELIVHK